MLKRIKQYIDFENIPISVFERKIGMSNASFGKSLRNNGTIGADKLEIILKVFPNLNPIWLITGTGEMLLNPVTKLDDELSKDEKPQNANMEAKQQNVAEENIQYPSPPNKTIEYLLTRIEQLAAENALLKKENEELKKHA